FVPVFVGVKLGVEVCVAVGVRLFVAVSVAVPVKVSVKVMVDVPVAVGLLLLVAVPVNVGVEVIVAVTVFVPVEVGVELAGFGVFVGAGEVGVEGLLFPEQLANPADIRANKANVKYENPLFIKSSSKQALKLSWSQLNNRAE